jgi:hypothetical protein
MYNIYVLCYTYTSRNKILGEGGKFFFFKKNGT